MTEQGHWWDSIKHQYRGKRIAIYGMGEKTIQLLEKIKKDEIKGVMDSSKHDGFFMGFPVMSEQNAQESVDLIVILARDAVLPIIYQRIKHLTYFGICIIDCNGTQITDDYGLDTMESNPYWSLTYSTLIEAINIHEIISFDVFDTLLMRKIMRPQDLFGVVEKELREKHGIEIPFSDFRKEAEKKANQQIGYPAFQDIYDTLGKICSLSRETIKLCRLLETEIERKLICSRLKIVEALNYALKNNKRVFLITDMYFDHFFIEDILNKNGIKGYEALCVSCEYKAGKWPDGKLFQRVIEKYHLNPQKMLHIGDSYGGDIECAKRIGIDPFLIWSAYEMATQSEWRTELIQATTVEDYLHIGALLADRLNNPFVLGATKGKRL